MFDPCEKEFFRFRMVLTDKYAQVFLKVGKKGTKSWNVKKRKIWINATVRMIHAAEKVSVAIALHII